MTTVNKVDQVKIVWQDMQTLSNDEQVESELCKKPWPKYVAKNTATLLRSNDITCTE